MGLNDIEQARQAARNLVELLASYEEDLMAMEPSLPAVAPLRRAIGMAIAEACYLISDESAGQGEWTPPGDAEERRR